jgi:hypothetical protein
MASAKKKNFFVMMHHKDKHFPATLLFCHLPTVNRQLPTAICQPPTATL